MKTSLLSAIFAVAENESGGGQRLASRAAAQSAVAELQAKGMRFS